MKKTTVRLGQPTLAQRLSVALMAMLTTVAAMAAPAFAAFADVTTGVQTGMAEIYGLFQKIILPIAVIGFVACLFGMLFGGQKGMEKGKQYLIILVIVVAGVYLAPVVINTISGWFSRGIDGSVWGNVFGTATQPAVPTP